jgi:hypothetical protein
VDPVSLTLIETKILEKLFKKSLRDGDGQLVSEFDVRKGIAFVNKAPAVCVALEDMGFEELPGGDGFTWSPGFALYEVFRNVGTEGARRKGAYPMLEGAIRLLSGQTLGLEIERLLPESCAEIIHSSLEERSFIAFKTIFRTSFDVDVAPDEELGVKLLRIGAKFYGQDPKQTDPDMTGITTVRS